VNTPADAVRRLQDHQIRDPSVPQPLPRRDPCCKTSHCTTVYVTVISKAFIIYICTYQTCRRRR
jgi:hypothetical protein